MTDLPRRDGLDYGEWASGGLVPPRRDDWLGPFQLDRIYQGDARQLAKYIPDESVDLIFTDPVYDRIDDYRWLAETAARVLKPGGSLLTFYGIGYLPQTAAALIAGGLRYRWQGIVRTVARVKKQYCDMGWSIYAALLWFDKGDAKTKRTHDLITVPFRESRMTPQYAWTWGKPIRAVSEWIGAFTQDGGLVLDPFTGGGTVPAVCKQLGRRYLAFEIDHQTCLDARQRVVQTQPPLFVLEPQQLALPEVAA